MNFFVTIFCCTGCFISKKQGEKIMKKMVYVVCLLCLLMSSAAYAETYTVKRSDTFGSIVENIGCCSLVELAKLNQIIPPAYTIRVGQVIVYPSKKDFARAREWAIGYAEFFPEDHPEFFDVMEIIADIDAGKIEYGNNPGTHASEIIVISNSFIE